MADSAKERSTPTSATLTPVGQSPNPKEKEKPTMPGRRDRHADASPSSITAQDGQATRGERNSMSNKPAFPVVRNNSTAASTESTNATAAGASMTKSTLEGRNLGDSLSQSVAFTGIAKERSTTVRQENITYRSIQLPARYPTPTQPAQFIMSVPNNYMVIPPQATVARDGRTPSVQAPPRISSTPDRAPFTPLIPTRNPRNGSSMNAGTPKDSAVSNLNTILSTHNGTPPGHANSLPNSMTSQQQRTDPRSVAVFASPYPIAHGARGVGIVTSGVNAEGPTAPRSLLSAPSAPDQNSRRPSITFNDFLEKWSGLPGQRQTHLLKSIFQNTQADQKEQIIALAREFIRPSSPTKDNTSKDTRGKENYQNKSKENGFQTSTDSVTAQPREGQKSSDKVSSALAMQPSNPLMVAPAVASKSADLQAMIRADHAMIDAAIEAGVRRMKENSLKRSRYNFELDKEEDIWDVDEVIEKRVRHEYLVSFKNRDLEAPKWVTPNSWKYPIQARRELEKKLKEAFGEPVVAALPSVRVIPQKPLRSSTSNNPHPAYTDDHDSDGTPFPSSPSSIASHPTKRGHGRPRKDGMPNTRNDNSATSSIPFVVAPVPVKRPRGRLPKNQLLSPSPAVMEKQEPQTTPKPMGNEVWVISDDSS